MNAKPITSRKTTPYIILLLMLILAGAPLSAQKSEFKYRIIYDVCGITKNGWKKIIDHMKMAAQAGYNGHVICEHEFGKLEKQPPEFFSNFQQVVAEGAKHEIKVIPWHFYQTHAARENWNLAEAFPVKGTKFIVEKGEARGIGDHETGLKNGDFESSVGNSPTGWSQSYLPSSNCVIDRQVYKSGKASLCVRNAPEFARIIQTIKLKPFRAYRISAWFKTGKIKSWKEVQFGVEGNNGGLLHRRERPFGTPIIDPEGNRGGHWTNTPTWKPLSPNRISVSPRPGVPSRTMSRESTRSSEMRMPYGATSTNGV